MATIEIIRGNELKGNETIKSRLIELVAPYYESAKTIVDYHYSMNDALYISMSETQEINSFFMVGAHRIPMGNGSALDTYYLGLSASSPTKPNNSSVVSLYKRFLNDARKAENRNGSKSILWGVTASPVVFRIVHRVFGNTQPKEDGSYDPSAKVLAERMKEYLGYSQSLSECHPFIMRGLFKDIRYSIEEKFRISQRSDRKKENLFDKYQIKEENGDRVLMICGTSESRSSYGPLVENDQTF